MKTFVKKTCKKLLSLLVVMTFMCTFMPMTFTADAASSTSSQESDVYYNISSREGLEKFRDIVNSGRTTLNARLTKNIKLKGTWTPIGNSSNVYTGTFDGQGHTISNLKVSASSANAGLFGYSSGTIKSLKVSGKVTSTSNNVGGIVGYNTGTLTSCESDCEVTGVSYVGGIIGDNESDNTITSCVNRGKVTASAGYFTGGIAGYNKGSKLTDCHNRADIKGKDEVGGIVGRNENGLIENCTDKNEVKGVNHTGGIAGDNLSGTITGSYNTDTVTSYGANGGGVVGYNSGTVKNSYNTGKVSGDGQNVGGVAGQNAGGTVTGCRNEGKIESNKSVVSGVVGYNTGTVESSYNTGEISGKSERTGGVVGENAGGTVTGCRNEGKVEGSSGNVGGVAGYSKDGEIKNSYNTGEISSKGNNAGGIAGYSESAITGCYNTGKISCGDYDYIGGIVGRNLGTVESSYNTGEVSGKTRAGGIAGENETGTIKDCHNTGKVSVDYAFCGGITGDNYYGTVERCYNTGSIQCGGLTVYLVDTGGECTGGIAGRNEGTIGTIKDCYNTGKVKNSSVFDKEDVGGIAGTNNGTIETCYNTGEVSGKKGEVGAIVGIKASGTISDCYYLNTTQADSSATAKTAAQLASGEVTYLLNGGKTDGTQTWYQTIGTDSFPVLDSSHGTVYSFKNCSETAAYSNGNLTGSELGHDYDENGICENNSTHYQPAVLNSDGVYEISNAGQLAWFSALVRGDTAQAGITGANGSANAKLMNDIDLSVICSESLGSWTPISEYSGTFDGNGYTVSGLYINGSSSNVGLFGTNKGTIKNLTVEGSVSGAGYTGGIAGNNDGGTITSCLNKCTISGTDENVGGIAGRSSGTITNCGNTGDVTSTSNYVGGITGYSEKTISSCYNTGNISGVKNVSGVVGASFSNPSNCYYLDTATADSKATAKTAEQFASGEVTYLLNGGKTDGTQAWYQTLGTDSTPVLTNNGKNTVYEIISADEKTVTYENGEPGLTGKGGPDFDLGDVNVDGTVDITDVTALQKYIAQIISEDDILLDVADVDSDNTVTIADATKIQKYLAQIITTLA